MHYTEAVRYKRFNVSLDCFTVFSGFPCQHSRIVIINDCVAIERLTEDIKAVLL